MKVKILKTFTDKETRKLMKVGDVAEYAEERGNHLISKKYAEKVEGGKVSEKVKEEPVKNKFSKSEKVKFTSSEDPTNTGLGIVTGIENVADEVVYKISLENGGFDHFSESELEAVEVKAKAGRPKKN